MINIEKKENLNVKRGKKAFKRRNAIKNPLEVLNYLQKIKLGNSDHLL